MQIKLLNFISGLILIPLLVSVSLLARADDNGPAVMQAPHFEDFNSLPTPEIPEGWHKIVNNPTYAQATVGTNSGFGPITPPNHVRLLSDDNADADIFLITPLVENYTNKRIRFYSRINLNSNKPDLIIGTMTDPTDATTFTPFHTLSGEDDLTNSYQQFIIDFDATINNNTHIAFKHGSTPSTGNRNIFIDNFAFEEIPTSPVLFVYPSSWDFGKVVFGETSNPKEFILENTGIGNLEIAPTDITITGTDAERFILTNLTEMVTLGSFETTTISIAFSPVVTGEKEATLQVKEMQIPLLGEGFDPLITQLPHTENFANVTPPDMALGWSKLVNTTSTGGIETIGTGVPNSPPYHVRFQNMIDVNAQLLLITPEIAHDLSELRVRFYAKAQSGADNAIEVGTISNPGSAATFTSLASFTLTTSYQEFTFSFSDYEGTDNYVAFKGVFPSTIRTLFLDDFVLEVIPEEPIMHITPQSHNFGQWQTGTASHPVDFTISNHGEGLLVIEPGDITISGEHFTEFTLNNLEETAELAGGESVVFSVVFNPETEGEKTALLTVDNFEIPLTAEGIDATITEFPWIEDFSGVPSGNLPFGWMRNVSNWRVTNTDHAGGEAPELRFMWSPAIEGRYYTQSPLINTSDFTEMKLSFQHYINNYGGPGPYDLRVVTIVGDQEHLIFEWKDPSNVPSEQYWAILTQEEHGIGAENLRIAFIFDGSSLGIRDWNIDDVTLESAPELYTVSITVAENAQDEQPIPNAVISFDTYVDDIVTNEEGVASIMLPDGFYTATVTAHGYQPLEINFTVDDSDMQLTALMTDILLNPHNLQVSEEGLDNGEILFSWQHNESKADKVFTGFNVFLDELTDPLATTEAMEYLFIIPQTGNYTAGVQAVYTTGVSDVVTLDFFIEVTDIPVVELPWSENFTGINTGDIPQGWTKNAENWAVNNTSHAGGTAPEMRFNFTPEHTGEFYLRSPYINTSGLDEAYISFKTLVNNFSQPGEYTLKVVTLVDGVQHLIHQWENPGDIDAFTFSAILTDEDHGIGSDSLRIAWIFDGNSPDINWWVFDDLLVSEVPDLYTVTFDITDQSGNPVQDAVVTFNQQELPAGEYILEDVAPGNYSYIVSKTGHYPTEGTVTVTDQDVTVEVVLVTHGYTLTFEVEDEDGNPLADAVVTLDGTSYDAGEYVFDNLPAGTYSWTVSLSGFFDSEGTVEITDEDVTVNVILSEDDTSVTSPETLNEAMVYPNPANQEVNIQTQEILTHVFIYDILGQQVYGEQINHTSARINVSDLKPGIYLLKLHTQEGSVTRRIQVSR